MVIARRRFGKAPAWESMTIAGAWDDALRASQPTDEGVLTQYQTNPCGFLIDVLGVSRESLYWSENPEYATHTWDGTLNPLVVALECMARSEWVALSSGTSTGKTFVMAAALLWKAACFADSVTVTVAVTEKQMEKGVWREVGRMFPAFQRRFPRAELTSLRLRMDTARGDAWGAWAVTAQVGASDQSAVGMQGLHAEQLLILADEMAGTHPAVLTALVNTATDPHNVIAGFGNPDSQLDPLAVFSRQPNVRAVRVSALDHPNVVTKRTIVPGAVSVQSVATRATAYGDTSNMYLSRVRGIAPAQSADALVHRAWCDAAVARGVVWGTVRADGTRYYDRAPVAYGVDPSNSDAGDEAAVARFQGPLCTLIVARPCPDANVLGASVWRLAQEERVRPEHVGVDSIGVGAGTVNESRRLYNGTAAFRSLNGGAAPIRSVAKGAEGDGWVPDVNRFLNLRAQMYWQTREDLRLGLIGIPDDVQLIDELCMPEYWVANGKIVVEPKPDVRARLGRSPNKADAFVYANWVRPRTLAEAVPAADAIERTHGVVLDQNGRRRVATVGDAHPGVRITAPRANWWESWTG